MKFVLFYILICISVSAAAAAVIYPIMGQQPDPAAQVLRAEIPGLEPKVTEKTSRLPAACGACLASPFPTELDDRFAGPGPLSADPDSPPLLPLPPVPVIKQPTAR